MKKAPKIVIIGAGSASFGLTNLGAIMRMKELAGSTLSFCDLNAEGLAEIKKLAERINREWKCGMTIEASVDRNELLPGADFVVISVAIDREKCWESDVELGLQYGIRHYGENGGPGGFFHAARNAALIMPILRDIEKLSPNALVLNFTNPMTRVCTMAARYTKLKLVGICHQIDFGYLMAARILGKDLGLDIDHSFLFRWGDKGEEAIIAAGHKRFDILAAGVNHFTWYRSIKDRETGEELLPLFYRRFLEQKEFEPYTRALIETFGICPISGDAHCLEYLPYTSSLSRGGWQRYDIQMYPLRERSKKRNRKWQLLTDMAEGKESIEPLLHVQTERAEQIIAAAWHGQDAYDMAVNLPNTNGLIANMDKNAVVEVPAVIGLHGVHGIATGALPEPAAAFCNRQKTIVDLAVKGFVEGDKAASLQALALDPMIDDLDVARWILKDGIELYKNYLPQFFGKEL